MITATITTTATDTATTTATETEKTTRAAKMQQEAVQSNTNIAKFSNPPPKLPQKASKRLPKLPKAPKTFPKASQKPPKID